MRLLWLGQLLVVPLVSLYASHIFLRGIFHKYSYSSNINKHVIHEVFETIFSAETVEKLIHAAKINTCSPLVSVFFHLVPYSSILHVYLYLRSGSESLKIIFRCALQPHGLWQTYVMLSVIAQVHLPTPGVLWVGLNFGKLNFTL